MRRKKYFFCFVIFLMGLNLSAKGKEIIKAEHPVEYILDLSEIGNFRFQNNTLYGDAGKSTRQVCLNFTKFIRRNKPKAGDTVRVTGILISPIDIDNLILGVIDDSVSADYWLNLSKDGISTSEQRKIPDFVVSEIKAGEPYELNMTFPIKHDMKLRLSVQLAYGEQNGKPCKMQVLRLNDSYFGIESE